VRGFFWVALCRVGGELGEEGEERVAWIYRGEGVRGGCCRAVACRVVFHIFSTYMNGVQEVKGSNPFGPIIFTRWGRGVCGEFKFLENCPSRVHK